MSVARLVGTAKTGSRWSHIRWLPYLGLGGVLLLAASLRLYRLVPPGQGLLFLQDYDEAVWDTTAQLFLQGTLPYRDFFATLPPGGIYLLAAALRLVNAPWGSPAGLMATRYASVAYGLGAVTVVYCIGRRLGGTWTGLLAAALLAVDGAVVGMDRRAMLEPPLDLFSALAVLIYLQAFESAGKDRHSAVLAVGAGLCGAVAAMVKTPGFVVVMSIGAVSVLRRRWRETLLLAAGFSAGWLLLAGPFVMQAFGPFIKQVYFFQLLRPADGIVNRLARIVAIWRGDKSWLTVRLGLLGAPAALWLAARKQSIGPWAVLLAWAGCCALLILLNSSYWSQYYVQLAVPACLLAGALLSREWQAGQRKQGEARWSTYTGLALVVLIVAFGLVSGALPRQWRDTVALTGDQSPAYVQLADYLRANSSLDDQVLVFEPNCTFLASRVPAGAWPGHLLVDSYGEMLYWGLGIEERSLPELIAAVGGHEKRLLQPTFWQQRVQERVLATFERADWVIVDGRARYQVHPDTLKQIEARSEKVIERGSATLRRQIRVGVAAGGG